MRSEVHAGHSISICKSISIRTRNPARARSRRVGCSIALRVPVSRARAARARSARSRAPPQHPQARQQRPQLLERPRPPLGGCSRWGGSKLAEPRGTPSADCSLKGGKSRGGRAAVPKPPAPDPYPWPQHARPAGVTGSARSHPAAQPGALAGHSDRRPGAMSHEAAR